jgi:hypothetical protein
LGALSAMDYSYGRSNDLELFIEKQSKLIELEYETEVEERRYLS